MTFHQFSLTGLSFHLNLITMNNLAQCFKMLECRDFFRVRIFLHLGCKQRFTFTKDSVCIEENKRPNTEKIDQKTPYLDTLHTVSLHSN